MKSEASAPIQSAGGIIYYLDIKEKQPKFLILKRHALSKKIEWVAPKGKIQEGEKPEQAALREISEEVNIEPKYLLFQWEIWKMNIFLQNEEKWIFHKDITYFLFEYKWNPNKIKVVEWEGYLGVYKWASLSEILSLIYYPEMREIFLNAYNRIKQLKNLNSNQ